MCIALVIGGAGFVGSHLADTLLARGWRVRVLDDFSSGTLANLPGSHSRLQIIHGAINDLAVVSRATEGATYVFHLATPAYGSCGMSMSADRLAYATDTLNVLAAAHGAGVKRLIYSSCESVYGPGVARPLTETDPTLPLSPYAFAKLTGEQQCIAFSAMFGMETVRLRYFNVFGPRQVSSGARPPAIFQILKTMLLGQNPTVEGTGDEAQDFIYVDDVVYANVLATEAPRVSGKVYNIARGRPTTLNEVVATVNSLLGTDLQPRYVQNQARDAGSRLTDNARAEVDLGFCPGTDLEQGLRRCIAYYKAHPGELTPHRENHLDGPHFSRGTPDAPGHRAGRSAAAESKTNGLQAVGSAPIAMSTSVDTLAASERRVVLTTSKPATRANT